MDKPNKLEMSLLKFIIARFKSKSPRGYAMIANACGFLSIILAGYVITYNLATPQMITNPIFGKIDNVCIVLGAAFSALGLGAASTTTDPNLASQELKDNVINQTNQPNN